MIRKLKEQWRELRESPPGSRFRLRYERRKRERETPLARIGWTVLAVLLVLLGIVALPLPGPGMAVIALGLALLAQESLAVAKLCDRLELAIRRVVPA